MWGLYCDLAKTDILFRSKTSHTLAAVREVHINKKIVMMYLKLQLFM